MIEGYLRRLGLMDAGGPVDYLDPQRMNLAKSWPTSGAIDSGINPQMTRPVRSSFPNPADYADEPPSRIGQAIDDYRAGKRDDTGAMLASAATNVASMPLKMMTLEGMHGLGKSAYDAFMTPYRVLTSPEPVTTEQMIEPAANIALTAPLGGAAIGKAAGAKMVEDNAAGIFGGRLARTADHAKLAQAEEMAGKGVPREQIWNDTGWFQGVDGKWRFEIDDSGATYQGGRRGKLSSIVDHPDLYDAYPEAGRAKVYPRNGSSGGLTEGLTGPVGNRIIPHQIEMGSRTDPRKAFLHESQHIAQAQEGFSRGANLKDPDYWGNLGEQEARAVEKRADLTPSERAERPPWLDYSPLYSNSKEASLPGLLSQGGDKGLPMDTASRMQRARDMGFDTDKVWYHATRKGNNIDEFKSNSNGLVYFSDDPSSATIGASAGAPHDIIPVYLRSEKPFNSPDTPVHWMDAQSHRPVDRYKNVLDATGRDLVYVEDEASHKGAKSVAVLPNQVRRTDAAFDPAKRDSANLLAANPEEAAPLSLLSQGKEEARGLRLYRGEGANPNDKIGGGLDWSGGIGDAARGNWFTTSLDEAKGTYAGKDGKVYYVDVPHDRMGDLTNSVLFPAEHYVVPGDIAAKKQLHEALSQGIDTPQGITAYHGSPHDFDRFSMDKIGTGEGAQAYGHGLYFAENENTAKSYRTSNGPAWMSTAIASRVQNALNKFPNDKKAARQSLHDAAKAAPSQGERQMLYDAYNNFDSVASGAGGHMYEVRINAEPEHFLDWDKPRDQLSPKLQEWAAANHPDVWDKAADGASFYKHLQDKMTPPLPPDPPGTPKGWGFVQRGDEGQPRATQALRDAGIPGIRYLDQGSRTAGEGSRNFVVFDDKLISIVRKYGWAGAAAMLGMSADDLMAQAQAAEQQPVKPDPYREALRMKARAKALGINP